jgi:hypothetical protein
MNDRKLPFERVRENLFFEFFFENIKKITKGNENNSHSTQQKEWADYWPRS